jgi:hypothetical protein
MSLSVSARIVWMLTALVLFAVALVLLRACDLQALPLYAHKYCAASRASALAAEIERHTQLQEQLRLAELRIAEQPLCQPSPRPTQHADIAPPTPQPTPPLQPTPSPTEEKLRVPPKLSDLRGCWESVRGDLPIVSDDEKKLPIGNVRQCYCFGANGQGQLKLLYTNGVRCRAPVAARLTDGKLQLSYPRFSCVVGGKEWGLVPGRIECRNDDNPTEAATCDWISTGRRVETGTEQYRRVEQDHCGG